MFAEARAGGSISAETFGAKASRPFASGVYGQGNARSELLFTRHTSHVTRHTSHVTRTRHTSHVTRHTMKGERLSWTAAEHGVPTRDFQPFRSVITALCCKINNKNKMLEHKHQNNNKPLYCKTRIIHAPFVVVCCRPRHCP